jgi:hypothetical protein
VDDLGGGCGASWFLGIALMIVPASGCRGELLPSIGSKPNSGFDLALQGVKGVAGDFELRIAR